MYEWQKVPITKLPASMAERALWARNEFIKNPKNSQIDDEILVWCFHKKDGLWYSISGRYSRFSPEESRLKDSMRDTEYQNRMKTAEEMANEHYERIIYQTKIRMQVLERDNYTCQICKAVGDSKLHVHHVLKRTEGGTDHLDNLLTVCNKCHKSADTKFYDPDWE